MTVLMPVAPATSDKQSGQALELDEVSCRYGRVRLFSRRTSLPIVVENVSLSLASGETLALVGESGSGKSTLAKAIAGLHPVQSGRIRFAGIDITQQIERRAVDLRRQIQIIFQNPDASLNHRHRIGTILARPLKLFFKMPRARRGEAVASLLEAVQLPADYATRFPSEISGGERQRIAIARALAAEPQLLLCDEVVSALDVSVQATILDLLQSVQQHRHLSILFITHDLAVVRWFADRVAVLYRGQLCEVAPVERLFAAALHPYTRTLLEAVPQLGRQISPVDAPEVSEAAVVTTSAGCAFAGQCAHAIAGLCREMAPPWHDLESGTHRVRCHLSPAALAR